MIERACVQCGAISPSTRCPAHTRKGWDDGQRRSRTVSGWEQQRRAKRVLREHDGICHWCGQPGATIADHVTPLAEGGQDNESNLRPIHAVPCHRDKTQAEAQRARARASR